MLGTSLFTLFLHSNNMHQHIMLIDHRKIDHLVTVWLTRSLIVFGPEYFLKDYHLLWVIGHSRGSSNPTKVRVTVGLCGLHFLLDSRDILLWGLKFLYLTALLSAVSESR